MTKSTSKGIRRARVAFAILALVGLVVIGVPAYHTAASHLEARAYPPIGTRADIGTHTLHYISRGEGTPTVVMDAGLPGTCLDWSWVQDALSQHTQVIAYDRAGYGWSDPGSEPRTSRQVVAELHALLEREQIEGPYILVGHSFGGLNMLLFAHTYPEKVAGLVLVDATHPDYAGTLPSEFADIERSTLGRLKIGALLSPIGLQRIFRISMSPYSLPEELEAAGRAMGFRAAAFRTAYAEFSVKDESLAQVRQVSTMGDTPLLVITKGRDTPPLPGFSQDQMKAYDQGLDTLQQSFLSFSANSRQITATESGHFVHYDQPELVVQAIGDMINVVSSGLRTDSRTGGSTRLRYR